jgi:ABC-type Mn2+/Zn2+ transport system ATPase subunit
MDQKIVFSCRDFSPLIQNKPLFLPLTVDIMRGAVVQIAGSNGVGKSTLLRFLSGQNLDYRGRVLVRPTSQRVLYLPQMHASQSHLPFTLEEACTLFSSPGLRFNQKGAGQKCKVRSFPDWFTPSQRRKSWSKASGGERVRALLAGFFCFGEWQVLLFDEPMNHLDASATVNIQHDLIQFLASEGTNTTMFIVSHDPLKILRDNLDTRFQEINLDNFSDEVDTK